ncbi:MAG TPA: M28 family metallopeptidase [Bryobacteraceae bacterium]|nr:M28 family metallopeptidase [Bryobacteraceae bacterium]
MKKPFAALVSVLASSLLAAERSPEAQAWWSHVEFLAGDALEGRRPGTEGYNKAAAYVASQFDSAGLRPGGDRKSFLQSIAMETRLIDEASSSLEWVVDGKTRKVRLGEEANLGIGTEKPAKVEAEVVFVGYALKVPEAKIDDFAGLDLKGKIACYIAGGPAHLPAPLAAHAQSAAERLKNLRAAGAIGTVAFPDPRSTDVPWARATLRRLGPSVKLVDPALNDNAGLMVSVSLNVEHANLFFAGSGHTVEELLDLHRANKPLPRFPLKGKLRANTVFSRSPMSSSNVIGILPGASEESVVISAHLDHLGVGGAINGDTIYNGAMDNASGISTLIEVARTLSKQKLKRTVVFLAVTGEEGGLMGSKYFATHPTIAPRDIVANINLDMYLPIIPLKALTVLGMDESDLGPEFAAVASKFEVKAERDPQPQRNLFIRSDQYSFIRRGVPALTFKFHAAPGTPEEKVLAEWVSKRYHAPSDDLQQPVDPEAAVKFNRLMAAFITQVANRGARPQWNKESFFRRYTAAQ